MSWVFTGICDKKYSLCGSIVKFTRVFHGGHSAGIFFQYRKKLRLKLEKLVYVDELMGSLNYRWTIKGLEEELKRCRRYGKYFSVVMIDVDHFKKINDLYSHLADNQLLSVFLAIMRHDIRGVNVLGRYGGMNSLLYFPK